MRMVVLCNVDHSPTKKMSRLLLRKGLRRRFLLHAAKAFSPCPRPPLWQPPPEDHMHNTQEEAIIHRVLSLTGVARDKQYPGINNDQNNNFVEDFTVTVLSVWRGGIQRYMQLNH